MRLAFAIASLFPSGGLQRECLALARLAEQRGHDVTLFTADLRGAVRTATKLVVVEPGALTNPGRDRRLGERVAAGRDGFDRLVGFNKMPGLDVLYCADPPYRSVKRGLSRFTPRTRAQHALEGLCFARSSHTALILLSEGQADAYRAVWHTPAERIAVLPPSLAPGRRRPDLRDDAAARAALRASLQLDPGAPLWLAVAAFPLLKGVDRSLRALRDHPDTVLAVAGADAASREGRSLTRMARGLGVAERLRLLGHREDIPELMAAADLLVHPARRDTTATVIVEAIGNGLPVVASAACGYAPHIARAGAGLVCAEPFDDAAFARALRHARDPACRAAWSEAGRAYAADPWLSSGHARAVDLITGPLWGCPPDREARGRPRA